MTFDFFGVLLGAIIAVLIVIATEVLRKPKIALNIIPPLDMQFTGQPASSMRSIRIRVSNKSLPSWSRLMSRNPALQCHGNITFHHLDGQNVFGRTMTARWSGAPEPNPLRIQIGNAEGFVFDPIRITHMQKMDIYAGESEYLDVAAKLDNEQECYGWSNENYFSNPLWRPPGWRLNQNRYLVKVTILSSGEKSSGIFRLINDAGQQAFRLEGALPSDHFRN